MGERPVPILLWEFLQQEWLTQSRRERIRQENGQLEERGFRLYVRIVQMLADHGGRQGITPPVGVNLNDWGPVELTVAHSFSLETNSICDGVIIQVSRNGKSQELVKITPWGAVGNLENQPPLEKLIKIEEVIDFIESSLKA